VTAEHCAFQYTILRLVPDLQRGERINVGVVVFCRQLGFLAARVKLDEQRLRSLALGLEPATVLPHLYALTAVAAGDPAGGPVASLPPSDRFGWLAAPSSTVIQPSDIHTGMTADAAATLDHLFTTLVA
jgi:hypothetical protein